MSLVLQVCGHQLNIGQRFFFYIIKVSVCLCHNKINSILISFLQSMIAPSNTITEAVSNRVLYSVFYTLLWLFQTDFTPAPRGTVTSLPSPLLIQQAFTGDQRALALAAESRKTGYESGLYRNQLHPSFSVVLLSV